MKLEGCTVLVTGGSRGLGRALVDALTKTKVKKIYASSRSRETLSPLGLEYAPRVVPIELDVTQQESVRAAAEAAADVDLLINNAGLLLGKGVLEAGSVEPLQREMDVNVYGTARMSLAFAPILKANGRGAIVNILSAAAWVNSACFGSYCISKAAAWSLTECLRQELRDQGTEVFAVFAGLIDTGMVATSPSPKAAPADVAAAILSGVEAGHLDIDADETARNMRAGLRTDPAAVIASIQDWSREMITLRRSRP